MTEDPAVHATDSGVHWFSFAGGRTPLSKHGWDKCLDCVLQVDLMMITVVMLVA